VNDLREEHDESAFDSMRVNSDPLIQMKLTQVNFKMKNNMNREFEHDKEL
jgi:hypothetical protein